MQYGPSIKSINDTMLDIDRWLRDQPLYMFHDYDGQLIERDITDEEEEAMKRLQQLHDLTTLRRPVTFTEWKLEMLSGCCNA